MNRLASETSPYLRQHADNPVDWFPWCDEALELARRENKPILLSIGYSACHWCHVMAHESFEDPATAKIMNANFVNIKVDREERPDIDKIYQSAHQLIQRAPGGWPLTVFLSPDDQRPFFAGTYFPNEPRHGMPSFSQLLDKAAEHYRDNRDEIRNYGQAVIDALSHIDSGDAGDASLPGPEVFAAARAALGESFDREEGGFGSAPKFPHPSNIERLLRHWRRTADATEPDTDALFMCALTLTRMAEGGIYDQVGGGFSRYSVDAHWAIPHFEKMLYDNGSLLALYGQLWQISGDELFRRTALDLTNWALREMQSPEGGFYAALDADSEGKEGEFYIWTPESVRAITSDEEYPVLAMRFGLDRPANFEDAWHLRVSAPIDAIAEATGFNSSKVAKLIDSGLKKLMLERESRVRPGRDDKILTSWNALMIRGLAIASRCLQDPSLASEAHRAIEFIRNTMIRDDQLLATFNEGQARFRGYLDDYAFLLDATIELLQARWDSKHLELATWLAERLLDEFSDSENGGFYFTAADHEALIHRSKSMADEAMPSGNGVAALALNRLGHLLGESRYIDAAQKTISGSGKTLAEYPHAHSTLLHALEEILNPPEVVILRGKPGRIFEWAQATGAVFAPGRLIFAIPDDVQDLPPGLATKKVQGDAVAYVCRGSACTEPLQSIEDLANELKNDSQDETKS